MKITKENLIAGIIAVVAFVAIICELIFGGVSTVSIAAAIKDITGIIVDVIVFILAFRFVIKKTEDEPWEKKLGNALDKWRSENANMIVRNEEYDADKDYFSFFMRTDIRNFMGDAKAQKKVGWFVRIPEIGSSKYLEKTFKIQFHLNVGTFLEGKQVENRKNAFEEIAGTISNYIQNKCGISVDDVSFSEEYADIVISVDGFIADEENDVSVDDRIQKLISIIDTAYICYLVAGNFKVQK